MRDIFVAIPAYTGDVCVQTLSSLLYAVEEAREKGWRIHPDNVCVRVSDADISQARNCFLGHFLKSKCTDLLFVDADISWGKGVFTRLLSHEVDFVAGAYRSKMDQEGYPILWPNDRHMFVDKQTGLPLLEAVGVGFGFTRLSRAGVEKIDAAAERHVYDYLVAPDVRCPWVFEFAWDGDQRKSEDYIFCKRWREVVGSVWIDPTICVDHTGKKTYLGDLTTFLRRQTEAELARLPEVDAMAAQMAMLGMRRWRC